MIDSEFNINLNKFKAISYNDPMSGQYDGISRITLKTKDAMMTIKLYIFCNE